MKLNSLSSRIVVFFSMLLVFVLAIAFLLVTTSSYKIARQQNHNEILFGERVFRQLLEQNQQQLSQAGSVLVADFGFRQAVTSNDMETIVSAMANHGQRINASFMMLLSLDSKLIAATPGPVSAEYLPPVQSLIRQAETSGSAQGVLWVGMNAYQAVVVPVLAPQPVAWITMGFIIDESLALDMYRLTSLQVSFFARSYGESWKALASTRSNDGLAEFLRSINLDSALSSSGELMDIDGYATLVTPLNNTGNNEIIAVLQRSTNAALQRFASLRSTLLVLAVISLLMSVIGSIVIARKITRPVNELSRIAERIKEGDYSIVAKTGGISEIGTLAESFNHMREAIAQRETEIKRLAYEDGLTGLPNRVMFIDELNRRVKTSSGKNNYFSVLIMDLNRFKEINETLGHDVGDDVLQFVARRLPSALRGTDIIACLGGDEFAMMLPTSSSTHLERVLPRLVKTMEEPFMVGDQTVDIIFSIGIANYPEHGSDAGTLLKHADIALNNAKRNRSTFAVYDPGLDASRQEHLHLLGELRKAVDNNELCLYYQPKVVLSDSRMLGVESLIRWRHPSRGFIPPAEFIPFAEHTGAILMLTRWVVENAISQSALWLSTGIDIKVSINVSARDLLNVELPHLLKSSLQRHRVAPDKLCLEITESAIMEDSVNAHKTVVALHEMGLELAIDDYGTGYSSLAYLKDLPVNELKIDRTFVMNLDEERSDLAIVESTIDLGHSLGMTVVAEGIETRAQFELLDDLGCDQAQGYFIGRPMPAGEFEAWLTSKRYLDLMQKSAGPVLDS